MFGFPKHFEMQFSEYTLNLLGVVLHNLEAAEKMFQKNDIRHSHF